MNWGLKITILYLGFVALILTLVFTCINQKTELESPDYYAQELKFQSKINARDNALNLNEPISHLVKGKDVEIKLPQSILSKNMKGKVLFMRPSDSSKDMTFDIKPDSTGLLLISNNNFDNGVYKMQLSISSNGTEYYKEDIVYLK
jgi:hypothetical protein